jgi:hypothetical protein
MTTKIVLWLSAMMSSDNICAKFECLVLSADSDETLFECLVLSADSDETLFECYECWGVLGAQ